MIKIKRKKIICMGRLYKTHSSERGFIQGFLTILIIILGIAGALFFIKFKKQPEQEEQGVKIPLVKVEKVNVRDIPMIIQGYGTVTPKVEVDIIPEVSGKVVYIHPELKVGGLIRANEKMLQIDPRDYELAVMQAEAAVADAVVMLDKEKAEALVAQKEWTQIHGDAQPTSTLVLREPQIRKAEATLDSAKAQLATAELRLERTILSLDFDILITSENVDIGQYIVTGQSLAKAYGTEAVEIFVPLEDNELAWFDVFNNSILENDKNNSTEKTTATVKANFAGSQQIWNGYVVRTTGQVDRTSRMISVVVEVPEPFQFTEGKAPLLPGIFAEVSIQGKTLHNAIAIPRDAIRQGNEVWVVNGDHLNIKTLQIVRSDKDFAYVASGIDDQVNVIISSLDVAIDGMRVRTEFDGNIKNIIEGN
jgi:RND family efflux transporter MFP subunit